VTSDHVISNVVLVGLVESVTNAELLTRQRASDEARSTALPGKLGGSGTSGRIPHIVCGTRRVSEDDVACATLQLWELDRNAGL
jgi:hypothetical protein